MKKTVDDSEKTPHSNSEESLVFIWYRCDAIIFSGLDKILWKPFLSFSKWINLANFVHTFFWFVCVCGACVVSYVVCRMLCVVCCVCVCGVVWCGVVCCVLSISLSTHTIKKYFRTNWSGWQNFRIWQYE